MDRGLAVLKASSELIFPFQCRHTRKSGLTTDTINQKAKVLALSFGEHLNVSYHRGELFNRKSRNPFPGELVIRLKLNDCKEDLPCDFLEFCTF